MAALLRNRLTLVWLLLVAVTLLAWWLASEGGPGRLQLSPAVSTGVVLIAGLKARLVIRHFMEVRSAPRWLGRACDGWLLALTAMVLAFVWS